MVVCLQQSAEDLHMVQPMPLLPNLHYNLEWFTFLVQLTSSSLGNDLKIDENQVKIIKTKM